ncbi:7103_t:CDS:1 [Diversispora eburnea]|uniref:7103_t:CDS:1 n=1 Tax=Diversispora eburnea TaxID=1213867 RepID=A0A9N8W344_9GLOM|nr:7103_t:CDS:1 [Diversispora eburnea]
MSTDELWTSTMDLVNRIQRVNIFPAPPIALQRAHQVHRRNFRGRRRPRHLAYFLYRNIVSLEINRINRTTDHRVMKLVSDIIWNGASRIEQASYRRISDHMNEYH